MTAIDNDGTSVRPQAILVALAAISGSGNVGSPLIASVSLTAESPNWQTASLILNHTVRNDLNGYKLNVRLNQNSSNTKLHGVRITYSISNPE